MSDVILYLICSFFVIGGIDYILGNRLKLGEKFEEGIKTMGALGIGMIGIYSLAPIFSKVLARVFVPFARGVNIDPSIFTSLLFATDMGGYQMANNLAASKDMALFSGIILASSFGATISFTIPLAVSMIAKEDREYFSQGVMAGLITIPIGCIAGGVCQGLKFSLIVWNLFPTFLLAIILVIGLLKIPDVLMKIFDMFGKAIITLSIIGLVIQGASSILGIKPIDNLVPISESMNIVGKIAFVLGGAYPMLAVINKVFKKTFENIGERFRINSESVSGLLGNLASNLLIFGTYKDMNPKGKVVCTAFGVSGAFVFGGQLGFVSTFAPSIITPFIVSKFAGGILSILLASWIFEHQYSKNAYEVVPMKKVS